MNIAILQTRYAHEQPGGGEVHTDQIGTALEDLGHDVTVYTTTSQSDRDTPLSTEKYSVALNANPIAERHLAKQSAGSISEDNDVCLLTDTSAAFAAPNITIPKVMVFHFVWRGFLQRKSALEILQKPQAVLYALLDRSITNHVDSVVAISPQMQEDIRKVSSTVPITYIPNGVDTDTYQPTGETSDEFTVHFQGHLIDVKNPGILIEALPYATNQWNVKIGGDGPLRDELEDRAHELGVEDRVEFLGYVPEDDLPSVYSSADLYALLSDYEGMPLTVLEATSCGTPVLASPRAGTDYVTPDVGEVITDLSPENVAKTIDRISGDTEWLTDASKNARELAETHDWSRIAEQYQELFNEVR